MGRSKNVKRFTIEAWRSFGMPPHTWDDIPFNQLPSALRIGVRKYAIGQSGFYKEKGNIKDAVVCYVIRTA